MSETIGIVIEFKAKVMPEGATKVEELIEMLTKLEESMPGGVVLPHADGVRVVVETEPDPEVH